MLTDLNFMKRYVDAGLAELWRQTWLNRPQSVPEGFELVLELGHFDFVEMHYDFAKDAYVVSVKSNHRWVLRKLPDPTYLGDGI